MLTGAFIVFLSLVALLAIPLTLTFNLIWKHHFHNDIKLIWLFGLVCFQLPTTQQKKQRSKIKKSDDSAHVLNGAHTNNLKFIHQAKFRRRIFRFVRKIWHAVHKENIVVHCRVGLGDPADTGQLWSVLGPLSGLLATVKNSDIRIDPEFYDMVFEFNSSGKIRVIPLQILFLFIGLLLSPSIWRTGKSTPA